MTVGILTVLFFDLQNHIETALQKIKYNFQNKNLALIIPCDLDFSIIYSSIFDL